MEYLLFIVALFGLLSHLAAALSTVWMMRNRPRREASIEFVSILKPLKGVDDRLETNLESFFLLNYKNFELIFCTADPEEPALELVSDLQRRYPHVASRIVVGTITEGLNPKVIVLAHATQYARGDLLLVSDSNVRVRPNFLEETIAEFDDPNVAVVSNIVAGVGESTLGATLENLQLNGFIAPAICLGLALRIPPCVVGKSMLIRREALESVGGWVSLCGVLAEDFVLGRRLTALGRKAVICPHVVQTVNEHWSLGRFIERHDRWLKMRWRLNNLALFFEMSANVTVWSLLAVIASGLSTSALVTAGIIIASRAAIEALTTNMLRSKKQRNYLAFFLVPLRDLALAVLWVHARLSRTIRWRGGQRLIIGKDSKLSLPPSAVAPVLQTQNSGIPAPGFVPPTAPQ